MPDTKAETFVANHIGYYSQIVREAGMVQPPTHYNGPAVESRPDLPRCDPVDPESAQIASNGQEQAKLQTFAAPEPDPQVNASNIAVSGSESAPSGQEQAELQTLAAHKPDPQGDATNVAPSNHVIDSHTPNLPRDWELRSEANSKVLKEFLCPIASVLYAWLHKMLKNCNPTTFRSIVAVLLMLGIGMWFNPEALPDTDNVFETAESYMDTTTNVANSIGPVLNQVGAAVTTVSSMCSTQCFEDWAATVHKSAKYAKIAKETLKSARKTYNGFCPANQSVKAATTSCKCLTQEDETKVLEKEKEVFKQKNKVLKKEKEIHEQLENAGVATNKLEELTNRVRSEEKKAKNAIRQNAAERNEMTSGYAAIRRQKKEHAAKQGKKAAEAKTATKANSHLY